MRNIRRTKSLLSATALTTVLASVPATAQDNTATTFLGRIVLGFGGTEQVAIDTPQAVTVLDQEDIDRESATTVGELFDQIPGVQAIGSGRIAGESFNIRGIGELSNSDESRIIVTVDGATKFYEQYRLGSFFSDPELYKRVEVLRGPASSTLYGSGAIGGVINFETKDASDFVTEGNTQALSFRLGYDSNGGEGLASVIYADKSTDYFETLFALNYREAGNYKDGDGTEIAGSEFEATSGLVKARYAFGDALEQSLTASFTQWQSSADDTQYSQTGTLGFGTVDRDVTDQTFALRYQNPASGNPLLDLDVVLSYSNTEVSQSDAEFDFGTSDLFSESDYYYRTTSLKVENTLPLGGGAWENYLTFGAQISSQDRFAENQVLGVFDFHPGGNDRRFGVYAQGEFILNDKLTIVPGLRADFVTLSAGDVIAGSAGDFSDGTFTAISPKLAAHYRLNDDWAVFGSVARTERAPTLDELYSYDAAAGSEEPNNPNLEMETSDSIEFGFSLSRQGVFGGAGAMDLKATAFYSQIENLIERDSTVNTPYYRNVGSSTIYGLEVEGAYQAERAFARLAYSDVRGEDDATGDTLSSVPARTLALTVGGRVASLGIEYGWRGTFVDDIAYGTTTYDSYATHDLFVDWTVQNGAFEGLKVALSVDNVLNETYRNSLTGDTGAGRSAGITVGKVLHF